MAAKKPVFNLGIHTVRLLIDGQMRSQLYTAIATTLAMLPPNTGATNKEKFMHVMNFGYDVVADMVTPKLPEHRNQLTPVQAAMVTYVTMNSKYSNYNSLKAFMSFNKYNLLQAALYALATKDDRFNLWKFLCGEFYRQTNIKTHPFHETPVGKFTGAQKPKRTKKPVLVVEEPIIMEHNELSADNLAEFSVKEHSEANKAD